jgi:hypothetical protein
VKLVRARFGDVVNLRRAVPALIDRIGQSVDAVTSEIEFSPKTRLVESPLLRSVRGSLVSSPSTMYPLESAGSPLNSTLPYPFVPPTKSLPLPAVLMRAPEANCKG